jgi:ABC-type phosphate transport system permease subunit
LTRTRTRRSLAERAIKALLAAAAFLSVLTTTGIVFELLREAIRFFGTVPVGDFFLGTKWTPLAGGESQSFGVLPLIWSTLYLTFIGLLVAIPVGLGVGSTSPNTPPRASGASSSRSWSSWPASRPSSSASSRSCTSRRCCRTSG